MTYEDEDLAGSRWPNGSSGKDTPATRFLKHVQECEICSNAVAAFCGKAQGLLKEALEVGRQQDEDLETRR